MGDVELYSTIKGRDFDRFIAGLPGVQDALTEHVDRMAGKAAAELAEHRHDGHSYIETDHGEIDHLVVLNDTRGQRAAMSIEFGRGPDGNGQGATAPLGILHHAAGLKMKATSPRSRRRKSYYKKKRR